MSAADKQQDYDDVAASIGGNLGAGDLGAMVDAVNMAYGRMPDGFTVTQGPDYELLAGTRGGLTVQYRLYCRDAADAYTPCNGLEDHAHIKPTYTGSVAAANMSIDSVQRTAGWIVRGPALNMPQLGGSGTDTFTSHIASSSYTLTIDDTAKHLMFTTTPNSPSAGTIDLMVTAHRERQSSSPATRDFSLTAHVAVTAADTATLTLDGAQTYALTLSTGAVVKQ